MISGWHLEKDTHSLLFGYKYRQTKPLNQYLYSFPTFVLHLASVSGRFESTPPAHMKNCIVINGWNTLIALEGVGHTNHY